MLTVCLLAGCGSADPAAPEPKLPSALVAQSRPIGHGARFHPPASGRVIGRCRKRLGPRFGVHVELFARGQVVLMAAGIGTQPPLTLALGRISSARCYGDLVTLEPTGVVLERSRTRAVLADVFRSWGQPLSSRRLASFRAGPGRQIAVYVDGRRWRGAPGNVPLSRHVEIVLEMGSHVSPHTSYSFPPGT